MCPFAIKHCKKEIYNTQWNIPLITWQLILFWCSRFNCDPRLWLHVEWWPLIIISCWIVIPGHDSTLNFDPGSGSQFNMEFWPGFAIQWGILTPCNKSTWNFSPRVHIQRGILPIYISSTHGIATSGADQGIFVRGPTFLKFRNVKKKKKKKKRRRRENERKRRIMVVISLLQKYGLNRLSQQLLTYNFIFGRGHDFFVHLQSPLCKTHIWHGSIDIVNV